MFEFKYSTVILVLLLHVFGPWETSYKQQMETRRWIVKERF